ncbi:MAG: tRNA dimethylallyltransferase, tRNA dimethylallyltransferase [Candidatus Peregrinibacteria bacterium GW2011_GWF2_39_17]|nr:MAG: tRNA dimethylallyltransferase, tRNA dimethylallyltransferase [Candidatus Peregrinibacteria bacterium GW2011_GWF2_39_17]HCW32132.1 tRNA (adenosine(37)-N6)-dimethylallyltransferase MiaA [Candidatus Peregrinibacteria bacterium]
MPIIEQVRRFLIESEKSDKKPLVVILGPTASGKTALSLKLSLEVDGEVISADSRQVYREMNIGTDKIEAGIRAQIPHHMIDIRDPDQPYNLAEFQRDAKRIIEDLHFRKKVPLLVGGTGLYISAIVNDYQLPQVLPDLNLRKELEQELAEQGSESLYAMLTELDPLAASKIHPNNHRYLIRALEIILSTQKPIHRTKGECPYEVFQVGIDWPNEILYERIDRRVEEQFERGLVEETRWLLERYDFNLPSMTGLGYKQVIQYLRREIALDEAVLLIKSETRSYARRQKTWFKRDASIYWIDGEVLAKELVK